MQFLKKFQLKKLNTFGIAAEAELFVAVCSLEELREALGRNVSPVHILGGGSNVLLRGNLTGLVIKNEIGGIEVVEESPDSALVAVGGGVNWHELVCWAIGQNLGGIENLSLIPGCAGAAPIQNIGAYGVELKDVFHHLEAVGLTTGEVRIFDHEECRFGYRDSVFKNELKGKYCISKIFLRLSKIHQLNTSYGDIQRVLAERGIESPTIRDVGEAVTHIRQSKIPDPAEIGNAGSFFKNPEIGPAQFQQLKAAFPGMVHYGLPDGMVKIPAGWLIEQAGWKGKRFGDAGCHAKQALVLVNYGTASGAEILDLSKKIQASVEEKFGILLTPEVNIW